MCKFFSVFHSLEIGFRVAMTFLQCKVLSVCWSTLYTFCKRAFESAQGSTISKEIPQFQCHISPILLWRPSLQFLHFLPTLHINVGRLINSLYIYICPRLLQHALCWFQIRTCSAFRCCATCHEKMLWKMSREQRQVWEISFWPNEYFLPYECTTCNASYVLGNIFYFLFFSFPSSSSSLVHVIVTKNICRARKCTL